MLLNYSRELLNSKRHYHQKKTAMQTIKGLPIQLKHCYLVLHKRRYVCSVEKIYETYDFLPDIFRGPTVLLGKSPICCGTLPV